MVYIEVENPLPCLTGTWAMRMRMSFEEAKLLLRHLKNFIILFINEDWTLSYKNFRVNLLFGQN